MSLTAEQLNERIAELSKFTPDDLQGLTVKALRSKLSACGVTGIDRDGTQLQVASCKKVELIDAIRKLTFKEKVVAQMVPDLTVTDLERLETLGKELDDETQTDYTDITLHFYKQLRVYVERRWDIQTQTWKPQDGTLGVLAAQLIGKLRSMYRDRVTVRDGVETFTSSHFARLNARTTILKRIEQYIETTDTNQHYFNEFMRTFGTRKVESEGYVTFRTLCFKGMSDDASAKKSDGQAKDEKRQTNRSVLNLTPLLQHAHSVLSTLSDNTSKTQWKEVVLALILVSGRRPYSELFCGAVFEVDGEYSVNFTGQAKTKGKSEERYQDEPSYIIPTLVNAELVVRGLEWLEAVGKRVDVDSYQNDIQRARAVSEKRYSKDLGAHMKLWVKEYVELSDTTDESKKITPHTLRELYALAACREFGGSRNYEVNFAAKILGHDQGDTLTAQKYQQDFLLSTDSVCKL